MFMDLKNKWHALIQREGSNSKLIALSKCLI